MLLQIPHQWHAVQRQIKADARGGASSHAEPLKPLDFHIPLFAAAWGVVHETCVVPGELTRRDKEALAACVTQGNLCHFSASARTERRGGASGAASQGVTASARRARSSKGPAACDQRVGALALWLRDANHPGYFDDNVRRVVAYVARTATTGASCCAAETRMIHSQTRCMCAACVHPDAPCFQGRECGCGFECSTSTDCPPCRRARL
jgi:hypothetical protein